MTKSCRATVFALTLAFLLVITGCPSPADGGSGYPVIRVENVLEDKEYIDLDYNSILDDNYGEPPVEPFGFWDLHFPTFNIGQHNLHALGSGLVEYIAGVDFSSVDASTALAIVFTATEPSEYVEGTGVFLIQTASGAIYKLGNATSTSTSPGYISFDYQQLTPNTEDPSWFPWYEYIDLDRDKTVDFVPSYGPGITYHFQLGLRAATGAMIISDTSYGSVAMSSFDEIDLTVTPSFTITPEDVAIVKTSDGFYYKIGNAVEDGDLVKFDSQRIGP